MSERVTKKDTDRLVRRIREAYERDPEKYSHLIKLAEKYPDDYNPEDPDASDE